MQKSSADAVRLITTETEFRLKGVLASSLEEGFSLTRTTDAIDLLFSEFSRARAATIARTETTKAYNMATLNGYSQSGAVDEKEWLSAGDSEVRDEEFNHRIDGEKRKLFARFSNGLQFPGEPGGEAGNVINCRCTTLPVVKEPPARRLLIAPGLLKSLRSKSNGHKPVGVAV